MNDFLEMKTIDGQTGVIDDCPFCCIRHHIPIVTREETYTHNGVTFKVRQTHLYCPACDEYYDNGGMFNENVAAFRAAYEKISGEK